MKILYVANLRLPTEKAHGLQIMKTIEAFIDLGHEVILLVPRRRNPINESVKDFYHLRQLPKIAYVPNYVAVLEPVFHKLYFVLQRILFGVSAYIYGLFSDADVVYSREITISFFLSLSGKKVVYEDHEPKGRFRSLYVFFLKHIPFKVVVALNLLDLYRSAGISTKAVIYAPNGVDLDEFKNIPADRGVWREFGLRPDKKIALYVGHFYAWKGVYTLLDAAKSLVNREDYQVVLIGGTSVDHEKVRTYIEKHAIEHVTLLSFMSHRDVVGLMKSADILVLPNTAREERSKNYTTPIKLFEYMASGVPIVATDVPSFAPYIKNGENAFLCEADNPQALAQVIAEAAYSPTREKVATNAQKTAESYTWEARVRAILDMPAFRA